MKREWDTSFKPSRSLKRQREDDDDDDDGGGGGNGEDGAKRARRVKRVKRVKRFRPAGGDGDGEEDREAQAIRRLSCTTTTSSSSSPSSPVRRRPSLLDICDWRRTLKTFQYGKNPKNTRPLPLDPWFQEEQKVNLYKFDEKPFARLDWAPGRDNGNPLYPHYGRMGNGMYELGGWMEDEVRILEAAKIAWEKRGVDIKTVLYHGVRTDVELDM